MSMPPKRTFMDEKDFEGRDIRRNIDLINEDVDKAIKGEAWMLAFVGICIALDILAQEHYFVWVFHDEVPQQDGEDIKVWAEERLFPAWDTYRKKVGSMKTIYTWALEHWGVKDEQRRKDIYDFRNNMAHRFDPTPFSINHGKSPSEYIVGLNDKGRKVLFLLDFFAFEKRIASTILARNGWQFQSFGLVETTED